ncbi:hypothetical protein DVH24_009829 [Malus domestica]|uniref:Uncharacterized protein n=1 Tax=Malus domestica TaxID=3750 RepID=A0A498KJ99_MALDO|nr:hypothetical protein DVH24_009829 [Malus domestica]
MQIPTISPKQSAQSATKTSSPLLRISNPSPSAAMSSTSSVVRVLCEDEEVHLPGVQTKLQAKGCRPALFSVGGGRGGCDSEAHSQMRGRSPGVASRGERLEVAELGIRLTFDLQGKELKELKEELEINHKNYNTADPQEGNEDGEGCQKHVSKHPDSCNAEN